MDSDIPRVSLVQVSSCNIQIRLCDKYADLHPSAQRVVTHIHTRVIHKLGIYNLDLF